MNGWMEGRKGIYRITCRYEERPREGGVNSTGLDVQMMRPDQEQCFILELALLPFQKFFWVFRFLECLEIRSKEGSHQKLPGEQAGE